ncbi:hypothetical protein LDENG_00188010 [Lucifuga dentata]|nr:hypothetical protein LDENG_00188010 [Lucifuga dentata]
MTGLEHLQNCSSCGVFPVCSVQHLPKVAQGRKTGELATGSWGPRLIDVCGERRLVRLVRSNRRAAVAQIVEKVNAGSGRKVSEHKVHRSLLRMGLRSRRLVRVPVLTPSTAKSTYNGHVGIRTGTTEQWKKVAWSDESHCLLHHADGWVRVRHLTGEDMAPGCTMG